MPTPRRQHYWCHGWQEPTRGQLTLGQTKEMTKWREKQKGSGIQAEDRCQRNGYVFILGLDDRCHRSDSTAAANRGAE